MHAYLSVPTLTSCAHLWLFCRTRPLLVWPVLEMARESRPCALGTGLERWPLTGAGLSSAPVSATVAASSCSAAFSGH